MVKEKNRVEKYLRAEKVTDIIPEKKAKVILEKSFLPAIQKMYEDMEAVDKGEVPFSQLAVDMLEVLGFKNINDEMFVRASWFLKDWLSRTEAGVNLYINQTVEGMTKEIEKLAKENAELKKKLEECGENE